MLDATLVGALYVARCRDTGLQPSQSGARRFEAEVAAAQPSEKDGGTSHPSMQYGGPRAVNLSAMRLGVNSAQLLARGASRPTSVHVHGNPNLGDSGAQALFSLLEHGTCRSVDLGLCGLGPSFAPALARHLLRIPAAGSNLERLELGGPGSGTLQKPNQLRGVAALAAVLQQRCPRLASLGLSYGGIGTTDDSEGAIHALAALLVNSPKLVHLDISHNSFGRVAAPLLQLLPLCPSLTELDVSGNGLADWGAEALAAALIAAVAGGEAATTHVNTLHGAAATIAQARLSDGKSRAALRMRQSALRTLALADNRIGVNGARALALALVSCTSLRTLNLSGNPVADDGLAAIAAALSPHAGAAEAPAASRRGSVDSVAALDEAFAMAEAPAPARAQTAEGASRSKASVSPLEALNVSGCSFGTSGARALGKVLRRSRLVSLRVARNVLTDAGIEALAGALPFARRLEMLDVSGCRVTDRAGLALAAAATRATSNALRSIRLHDNNLSDAGGRAILDALARPPPPPMAAPEWMGSEAAGGGASARNGNAPGGLAHLTLHGNQLSYSTVSALRDVTQRNRQTATVAGDTTAELEELAPCEPALHRVGHQMTAERGRHAVAQMQLASIERNLADVRKSQAELIRTMGEAHAAASYEEAEHHTQLAVFTEELDRSAARYQEERGRLEGELLDLLSRRRQLEVVIMEASEQNPGATPSPKKKAIRNPVQLMPGQEEPPPIDAELIALREKESEGREVLEAHLFREKRAHATRLWCEKQLSDIARVLASAKKPAKKK